MKIFSHLATKTLTNEFIVADENGDAIIIDPGCVDNTIISIIEDYKLNIKGYFITHSHKEHTGGFGLFQKIYPAEIFAYEYIVEGYKTIPLRDGDKLKIGKINIEVFSCAGHSYDSLVYKIEDALFTGDTLYAGRIASTKSNYERELLLKNIRDKILNKEAHTLLFPGRGALSNVRIERIFNIDLLESDATYL